MSARPALRLVSDRPPKDMLWQRWAEVCGAGATFALCPWCGNNWHVWLHALERFEAERLRFLIQLKDR